MNQYRSQHASRIPLQSACGFCCVSVAFDFEPGACFSHFGNSSRCLCVCACAFSRTPKHCQVVKIRLLALACLLESRTIVLGSQSVLRIRCGLCGVMLRAPCQQPAKYMGCLEFANYSFCPLAVARCFGHLSLLWLQSRCASTRMRQANASLVAWWCLFLRMCFRLGGVCPCPCAKSP